MKKERFIVHDRYSATGKPRPNPATVCKGQCEGMGMLPGKFKNGQIDVDAKFTTCPRCKGTGLEPKKRS